MSRLLMMAALLAAPALAKSPAERLAELTSGKVAGEPVECIRPDFRANPEILAGQGVVYFTPRTTYLNRLKGSCPQLRADRQIQTSSLAGRLCENFQIRIVQPPGLTGFGICSFGRFEPYTKAK